MEKRVNYLFSKEFAEGSLTSRPSQSIRVRRDLGVVEPLKTYDPRHGPALGLFDKSIYPTCRCPIAARDLILLFTDGIYEVDNPAQEEYGQERLLAAVRQRCALPAEQLFDELLRDVQRFSGVNEFEDDVCLVGMEIQRTGQTNSSPP